MKSFHLGINCRLSVAALAMAIVSSLAGPAARAEVAEVRIAYQYGLVYLPIMVMQRLQLVEKRAKSAGVNYLAGTRARVQTANGVAAVYLVKLDSLRVGDITVNNVDAAVIEGDKLGIALLGMSFLNRMEMRRSGDTLTLIKRF